MAERKDFKIFLKGEDRTEDVLSFNRGQRKVDVVFRGGKKFTYNLENVEIIESLLKEKKSEEVFNYLKKIALEIGLIAKINNKEINILHNHLSNINFVDEKSILGSYFSGRLIKLEKNKLFQDSSIVYPFGFNISQKIAVERAINNKISIIEGPPGTGKTQTILNLIANIVMRGQSVAVVSSNNSATQNVYEKLIKYKVDFLSANLGNTTNKVEFIEQQKDIPDLSEWILNREDRLQIQTRIAYLSKELETKLEIRNKLSALKQLHSSLKTEAEYFYKDIYKDKSLEEIIINRKGITPSVYLDLWLLCETFVRPSFFNRISNFIFQFFSVYNSNKNLINRLYEKYPIEKLIVEFQKRYFDLKLEEVRNEIDLTERELVAFNFSEKMKEYSQLSLKIFQDSIANKFIEGRKSEYRITDLRLKTEEFINDYPVVLSTTYSLLTSLSREMVYDYVIIDESSQVDICTGSLALSCARNLVVVGDLKQLPHVVDSKDERKTDAIYKECNLSEVYRYRNNSIMSSLMKLFPTIPVTLLREHYRCHPKIIEFCNRKFYDGQLIILTEDSLEEDPLVVFKTIEGNHARNRANQRQIDVILNDVIPKYNLNLNDGSVGIISPYRNQTNLIQKTFNDLKVKVDTVDKFQGQEKQVIILSTVDNEISDFTDNAQRLNVAISRAIKKLIVIVNDDNSLNDTNIGDLIKYIQYNNFSIENSKISSVFDFLYKSYNERRHKFLKDKKLVSKFDSENLMFNLIKSVLLEERLTTLDVIPHVQLKMIFKDTSHLDTEELRFVTKTQSHVDFLLYDSFSKSPLLAIEVDGVNFHKEGEAQSKRDSLKDGIFKKYDIPLVRFRTDGSNEREKLKKLMDTYLERNILK